MSAVSQSAGSAETWGPLWGARARDWAGVEEQQLPAYVEALLRLDVRSGQRVLEIGCGTGVFLHAAATRGASVHGVDASSELIAIARERVPSADLRVGEMESLPYEDDSFDAVAGFNSFFFATDMVAALREAGRVAKPGGAVLIQVWGAPERNDLEAMKAIARPFFPPRPPDAPSPPPLWNPGVLEQVATAAGLTPDAAFDFTFAYEFADDDALGRGMLAPAGLAELIGPDREPAVREQIFDALASYRRPDGSYRLENDYRYLIARA